MSAYFSVGRTSRGSRTGSSRYFPLLPRVPDAPRVLERSVLVLQLLCLEGLPLQREGELCFVFTSAAVVVSPLVISVLVAPHGLLEESA